MLITLIKQGHLRQTSFLTLKDPSPTSLVNTATVYKAISVATTISTIHADTNKKANIKVCVNLSLISSIICSLGANLNHTYLLVCLLWLEIQK